MASSTSHHSRPSQHPLSHPPHSSSPTHKRSLPRLVHTPSSNPHLQIPSGHISLAPPEPCVHPASSSADCTRCGYTAHVTSSKKPHPSSPPDASQIIVGRCPHCEKKFKMRHEQLNSLSAGASSQLSGKGRDMSDPSEMLYATFVELEETLRRHGNALTEIELFKKQKRRMSADASINTVSPLRVPEKKQAAGLGGGFGLPTPPEDKIMCSNHNSGMVMSATLQMLEEYEQQEDQEEDFLNEVGELAGIHPLVYDIEDVKKLVGGLGRLLRTLHDKVLTVEKAGKDLQIERKDVRRVMRRNQKVAEELEKNREEIEEIRLSLSREKKVLAKMKMEAEWEIEERGREREMPAHTQTARRRSRSIYTPQDHPRLPALTQFPTPPSSTSSSDKPRIAELSKIVGFGAVPIITPQGEVLWTPEKELLLRKLEARMKAANASWSNEAEEYYTQVEALRDQRHKAKKLAKVPIKNDPPAQFFKKESNSKLDLTTTLHRTNTEPQHALTRGNLERSITTTAMERVVMRGAATSVGLTREDVIVVQNAGKRGLKKKIFGDGD